MTDIFTGYGFADYCIEQKRHINTFLDKIDKLIDLETNRKTSQAIDIKGLSSADGMTLLILHYPCLSLYPLSTIFR